MRQSGRKFDQMREVTIEPGVSPYAEGSCLIKLGNTRVICTASIDETIPPFLRNQGQGWVTAEYSMLPRATHNRSKRESANGKLTGRTQEIQRLISRSLRSVMDLKLLGERQIIVDCDVMQADGGTRTAAITGGYVALHMACRQLIKDGTLRKTPIIEEIAAISCGICNGNVVVDLDYSEDSTAAVDANFVMSASGRLVEVQATAERAHFSEEELSRMIGVAKTSISTLIKMQKSIIQAL